MKTQYCSDLHIDFAGVTLPGGSLLILAGDIAEYRKVLQHKTAWETLTADEQTDAKYIELYRCWTFFLIECAKYDQVFYVAGNHCHYHGRFDQTHEKLRAVLPANIRLLEDEVVVYGGVTFIGSTLWTDANKNDHLTLYTLKTSMNDYRAITNHKIAGDIYHKLTPEVTVATHRKTLEFFRKTLVQYSDQPVVVITHHAPTLNSISPQYRTPRDFHLNGGYASDLSDLILDNPQIKTWIHGHVHTKFSYEVGTTRVLCNPRGYKNHEQIAEDFKVETFEI